MPTEWISMRRVRYGGAGPRGDRDAQTQGIRPTSSAVGGKLAPASARYRFWLLGGLFALALAWTLRAAASVALPIAVALVVALCVLPVSHWVQARVPRRLGWLGPVAAMLLVVAVLALFVGGLTLAAQEIASVLPRFAQRGRQLLQGSALPGFLGGPEQLTGGLENALRYVGTFATSVLRGATATAAGLVLVFFLVLLMLAEAPTWHGKLVSLSEPGERKWDEAVEAIGQRFRRYFLTRLVLGAATGLLYAGWLWLLGIDLLIVWGLLACLLNFVPTVGSLVAGGLAVIYVFVTRDSGTAAMAAVGILVIEQVMGNFIDPKLLGKRLAISPLVILVSLLVWSWVWGTVGALIAVPMTVLLIIVFAHVPSLRPVALLLSDEPDMAGLDAHTSADRTSA